MGWLQRLRIDKFLLVLILVVATASVLPAQGIAKVFFENLTTAAIALLFFMHGAKLSREAITAGMGHWRLHLVVFASTFILFPLLGIGMSLLSPVVLTPTLYLGFLYLCALLQRCSRLLRIPRWLAAMWRRRSVVHLHPVF